MAYKDYLKRIKRRNQNLINYHKKHPNMTQEALAKVFKIDQSRVARILKRYKKDEQD